jgi:hypothetical protein
MAPVRQLHYVSKEWMIPASMEEECDAVRQGAMEHKDYSDGGRREPNAVLRKLLCS